MGRNNTGKLQVCIGFLMCVYTDRIDMAKMKNEAITKKGHLGTLKYAGLSQQSKVEKGWGS